MSEIIRTPNIRDIDAAVRMYYEKFELSSRDIQEIFDIKSSATVSKLKYIARQAMSKYPGRKPWDEHCVPTDIVYEAWGLKIADLERRRKTLIRLGYIQDRKTVTAEPEEAQGEQASFSEVTPSEVTANV